MVVASARRQAAISEARALPSFADRLEGRLAAAEGDSTKAARLLRRSARRFEELGAAWGEAWSRQLLAEALVELSEEPGARSERLRSVEERERSTALVLAS